MKSSCFISVLVLIGGLKAQNAFVISNYYSNKQTYFRIFPSNYNAMRLLFDSGFVKVRKKLTKSGAVEVIDSTRIIPRERALKIMGSGKCDTLQHNMLLLMMSLTEKYSQDELNALPSIQQLTEQNEKFKISMLLIMTQNELAMELGLLYIETVTDTSGTEWIQLDLPIQNVNRNKYVLYGRKTHKDAMVYAPIAENKDLYPVITFDNSPVLSNYFGFYPERLNEDNSITKLTELPVLMSSGSDRKLIFMDTCKSAGLKRYRLSFMNMFTSDSVCTPWSNECFVGSVHPDNEGLSLVRVGENYILNCNTWLKNSMISEYNLFQRKLDSTEELWVSKDSNGVFVLQNVIENISVRVEAVLKGGHKIYSGEMLLKPPMVPDMMVPAYNLNATIIDENQVVLTWEDSNETDEIKYQVYRSDFRNKEFLNCSRIWLRDQKFTDTLINNKFLDSIYYYVVSSDYRYNESQPSVICAVQYPSGVEPLRPVITKIINEYDRIKIEFVTESYEQMDSLEIWRKTEGSNWLLCSRLANRINCWTDSILTDIGNYSYRLRGRSVTHGWTDFSDSVETYYTKLRRIKEIKITDLWIDTSRQLAYIYWKNGERENSGHVIYKIVKGRYVCIDVTDGYAKNAVYRLQHGEDISGFKVIRIYN